MSGEQGRGRIIWQQVGEVSIFRSLDLQSFPAHEATHTFSIYKNILPKAQLISRKVDGWQNKQNYIAGINKPDFSEVHKKATRSNSPKFQQGKFWLDENFTVGVVKQWNGPREAVEECPPWRQSELKKVLGNVIRLGS